eukprot:GHVU01122874.1.p1 GENE.GHVU01122874.1~~GHVU01122874.1.p1  ORF type:complete len:138 (-),score=19.47 GHVU01122874.1:437-850(-)
MFLKAALIAATMSDSDLNTPHTTRHSHHCPVTHLLDAFHCISFLSLLPSPTVSNRSPVLSAPSTRRDCTPTGTPVDLSLLVAEEQLHQQRQQNRQLSQLSERSTQLPLESRQLEVSEWVEMSERRVGKVRERWKVRG